MVVHRTGPCPAALFVESGGAIVANGAREPSGMNIPFAQTSFSIGHQNCGNAGTSRIRSDIELIQLSTLQEIKADSRIFYFRYAHTARSGSKSFLKALQRTQPGKFRRYDSGMSVLPAVEPDLCQLPELG